MVKDYYQTLGIDRGVPEDVIKSAYRKLALEYHPDRNPDNPEAEERFKSISEAYTVLCDPEKKNLYDTTGSVTGANSFNFRMQGDPFEIFRQFGMQSNFGPKQPRPLRGQNIQIGVKVLLVDALFGLDHSLEYNVSSGCDVCEGDRGTEFEDCPQCEGSGGFVQHTANMVTHSACGPCGGQGRRVTKVCDRCQGRGIRQEFKQVSVAIPPGIHNGAVLKLQGKGGRGVHAGPPGDLLLQVGVVYPDTKSLSEEEKSQLRQLLSKDEDSSS